MGDILIRDVDEQVVSRLKSKARINGTSLQAEAREALIRGSPVSGEERTAIFTKLDRLWADGPPPILSGAEVVREVRDEGETWF